MAYCSKYERKGKVFCKKSKNTLQTEQINKNLKRILKFLTNNIQIRQPQRTPPPPPPRTPPPPPPRPPPRRKTPLKPKTTNIQNKPKNVHGNMMNELRKTLLKRRIE